MLVCDPVRVDRNGYVNQNREQYENELVDYNSLCDVLSVQVSQENVLLLVHIKHVVLKKFLELACVGEKLSEDENYHCERERETQDHILNSILYSVSLRVVAVLFLNPVFIL